MLVQSLQRNWTLFYYHIFLVSYLFLLVWNKLRFSSPLTLLQNTEPFLSECRDRLLKAVLDENVLCSSMLLKTQSIFLLFSFSRGYTFYGEPKIKSWHGWREFTVETFVGWKTKVTFRFIYDYFFIFNVSWK